ncbi:hypothetical protein, partial [Streptomyces sp. NPDC051183]|uniref:hypothetical protein n=1 Tax=Streptomyces sp. NPDC051183 TaxID=3155165 RepID=UPI00341E5998
MAITRARKALFTGLVGTATVLTAVTTLGVAYAGPQTAGATTAGEMPSAIEDFAYPDAAKIQAEQQIILKRGDGHITLTTCEGTPDITVKSRTGQKLYCFDVNAPKGYVTL